MAKSKAKKQKTAAGSQPKQVADVQAITALSETRSRNRGFVAQKKDDKLKPKEKSEVELENLIFGDTDEHMDQAFSRVGHELSSDEEDIDERDEFDYENEGDVLPTGGDDLFFMDSGPTPVPEEESEDEEDEEEQEKAKLAGTVSMEYHIVTLDLIAFE